ncbi:MAG: hypothetical protein AAF668_13500 [Pseudomonadota bacterium]
MLRKPAKTVLGQTLPAPRVTRDGFIMMLIYFGIPIMVFFIGIDAVLYGVFKYFFGTCYGLWCWL